MTTIAPIDVDETEAAVVIDLENIRLSWEKKYGRLFQYTDLCWLCELAESRFRTSIGRVVIFMSNPSECETVCHEAFVEVKRILKYLKEDEARTANRPLPSPSLAVESTIRSSQLNSGHVAKGRNILKYFKPGDVHTSRRHVKAASRSTSSIRSEGAHMPENVTRDCCSKNEVALPIGGPPYPITRRISTTSSCSSITSSSSDSSLEDYSDEGLINAGTSSDSNTAYIDKGAPSEHKNNLEFTASGEDTSNVHCNDDDEASPGEQSTPPDESTTTSEGTCSLVSLLQKGRDNSFVASNSSGGRVNGPCGRRDRIEIEIEDDDDEDDKDDDDDEVLEISHLTVPSAGTSTATITDHSRSNILSSRSLSSNGSLGRPNNHGYWGIEGVRPAASITGCEDGEVVFAPGSKRRRFGSCSPSPSQSNRSHSNSDILISAIKQMAGESKASLHLRCNDISHVGLSAPAPLMPPAAAIGCCASELPTSVDTISCVSDSEVSSNTSCADYNNGSTRDENGSSKVVVAPTTGGNIVNISNFNYSIDDGEGNRPSDIPDPCSIDKGSNGINHGTAGEDSRSASGTAQPDLQNLQTARHLLPVPGVASNEDRRDGSGRRSDVSSHWRRWSRRRRRGTEASSVPVNLCLSEDEAMQQSSRRIRPASGIAASDSDSSSGGDVSPPEIRFGVSACPNAAVVVKVFGYKLSGSRRVQRCCDVSIGTEITKLCFSPRFSSIILFSADSDFDETARSCAEAEDVGGVIKYAKPIRIMGYASAFSNAASTAARRAFELRRAEVLRRRALSNRGPVLLHHNSPIAGPSRQLNGRDPDDDSDLLPTFSTHLIDLEFPIIHKLLSRSSRPLLPLERWRRHYPYHYCNNTSKAAPPLPQSNGATSLPTASITSATLSAGSSFSSSSSSTPSPAAAAINAAIATAAVPPGLIGNVPTIPTGILALPQVAAQGGLA